MTNYRIEYSIQRRRGGEDFTEIGFGSSGHWSTVDQAAHILQSAVENREWETSGDMPDPDTVGGEDVEP